jgi:solute carrier family 25 (mitochondrial citrate transporter), member 1
MKEGDANTPPLVSLIAGGTAGGIEATITYPFEYAKTRVQLRGEHATKNPFSVVSTVYRKEGIKALYMGCGTLVAVCFLAVYPSNWVRFDERLVLMEA